LEESKVIRIPRDEILERLLAGERDRPARARSDDEKPDCDHWARVVLLERVAYLRLMARFGEGTASDVLRNYPNHTAHLFVKLRSGNAEMHSEFASLIVVLDGVAQLVSGGAIENAETVAPGEITGSAIKGGIERQVRSGDVVHIAAGTPYQFLLSGEKPISYLQLKIRETVES
jgi:mannose-6-phosphate isomerase-like protein (cupin superfamily)